MAVWKTREEAYHGSKWGYVVVAVVIMLVLSLLGSIFYLIGEGIKSIGFNPSDIFLYVGVIIAVLIVVFIAGWLLVKAEWMVMSSVTGFFMFFWKIIWALFSNIYMLILGVIITIVLLSALFITVSSNVQVTLTSPLTIGVLVALLIILFPFAIFIIDLFSLEEE
jgi:hypothetical protein